MTKATTISVFSALVHRAKNACKTIPAASTNTHFQKTRMALVVFWLLRGMSLFGSVLHSQLSYRCKKWWGVAIGKPFSDKVDTAWRRLDGTVQRDLQARVHSTFENSFDKDDELRRVLCNYVNQLEEVKEATEACTCGVDKG